MADYIIQGTTLTAIADSIRAKTGSADPIPVADMATAIEGITGGGGEGVPDGYATVTFHYTDQEGNPKEFSRLVMIGDDCPDPWVQKRIETPTKESTAQYDYTFNGWASAGGGTADETALQNITEDKVLYAAFAGSVRMYTVTYYDEDGVTVLHTEQVGYGSMPSYVPTKEGAGFAGWTPEPAPITGDMSYTATWSSVLASGSCGANTTYTLTNDYVLTISGTDAIYNSTDTTKSTIVPEEYRPLVKKLVVEEGITIIGDYAFKQMNGLTTVILPESVTYIKQQAFNGCSSLLHINLPSGLTVISDRMFSTCTGLTSITIPSSVKRIEFNAFVFCGLTSVTFVGTDGWTFTPSSGSATALASADLADTAKAANFLTNKYRQGVWTKS